MKRTASIVILGLLAAGCATSGTTRTPTEGTRAQDMNIRMHLQTQAFTLRTTEDIVVITDTVPVPPDRLWSKVPAAYDALGVPITEINGDARALGAVEARVRGRIGGEPVSRYVRCGSTMTGEVADQYEVYLTAITQVESVDADAGSSVVSSHVEAVAQGASSGNTVRCATRGRLETDIHEQLMLEIGKSGGS